MTAVVSWPPLKRVSIVWSVFVDSALRSWKASLSSDARSCSLPWNGKAMIAASAHAASTTHLLRRPAASRAMRPTARQYRLQRRPRDAPRSGRQQRVQRAVLGAPDPDAEAVREVVGELQRGRERERDARRLR